LEVFAYVFMLIVVILKIFILQSSLKVQLKISMTFKSPQSVPVKK